MQGKDISIVIPAKNESENLKSLLPELVSLYPQAEIIVVNDGSTDATTAVCAQNNVKVINHVYSKGNGASIKTGARAAAGDIIVFMDGDGQHQPRDIPGLLEELDAGTDMVVGARNKESQASVGRLLANTFYNKLASWISGHKVLDLTSGFRAVYRQKFREFIYLLPNGFSYPTTITMAFFRAGYSVKYLPIVALSREGKSHINIFKDGVGFLIIIFKIGTLYSPLKIFIPTALCFFMTGVGYYIYTFITRHSFSNMSAVLLLTSVIVFLIGLVSEQITTLMYKDTE
ncbi:MAG: glycosyltransferase family 2 protein [Gammaproteobacteria bacterium]|nr:glycosyltransferase family 2 protein [Gammaproteobacteria bacterium]